MTMQIPFNIPPYVGTELDYVREAVQTNRKICGDGPFTKKCNKWMEREFGARKVLLTASGTNALEMAALLCEISPGDEVIMPSYTFTSTATAFSMRGAQLVFVDIRPDTMNIDENKIEAAISDKTKAICVVHYAGIACEMDTIMDIAHRHNLRVIEDAAQGVRCFYKNQHLGTIGDIGCYSFHETKNYSMGEGGAVVINDATLCDRAEIIREKGTNRALFLRGQVDKYTWVDQGSSYLPSDMNAAYLWAQLEVADLIDADRLDSWNRYQKDFQVLANKGLVELPFVPPECQHTAHMFYIKLRSLTERTRYIRYMKERHIACSFHYIPLHSAPAGQRFGRFHGRDVFTTRESERLVRLPMYYGLTNKDQDFIVDSTLEFFSKTGCIYVD